MAERSQTSKRILVPALLLAAVVVAFGSVSSYRKIESFQPLGFAAQLEAGHWLVTSVAPRTTGVATGDQIVLVNGEGFAHWGELGPALRKSASSELVLLRDGELRKVTYSLPSLEIDWAYLILALIGLGYLTIGFYTLLRDQRRPATLFFVWCLVSTAVYLIAAQPPFDLFGKSAYLVEEVARLLLAPLTLHLFAIFPRPLGRSVGFRRLVPFFYLPAAFLLLLQADLIFFNGRFLFGSSAASALAVLDRLGLIHLVAFSLAAAAVLVWRLRRPRERATHRQAIWIAIGMAAGYLPFLALYLAPLTLGLSWPEPVTALAVLPLALVPMTFAWAILRYKLWDIGVMVRGAVSTSLTVVIGVIGFSLANLMISRLVPENLALGRNMLTFASGLVIAGLLVPTRRTVSGTLQRLQYRGGFGRRRALAAFGRELLRERNLERLSRSLHEQLDLCLDLKSTSLLVVHGESLISIRPNKGVPDFIALPSFDETFWESDYEALTGVELPTSELTIQQRLHGRGFRYAFPLRVRDNPIGIVLAGYRHDDLPLSSDDLDLIRNLLNQAALAIENAQLLNQVQHQLDEVTRLQQFNQGIIESSPVGLAVLDENDTILSSNQTFGKIAGRPAAGPAERPLAEVLPIGTLPRSGEGLVEVRFTDPEGRERYAQVSVAPLQRVAGGKRRILVIQDVSERVQMENSLKEKERLASLGMLAAGVAHEVNTPITGISSYAQMLMADMPEDDPRRELLKKMEKQTFRAAEIVNNLLEFARNRNPDQGPVSVAPLLEECLDLLAERIAEHDVELVWRPPAEEVVVTGNEGELKQVFTNLVVNALQAMSAGGGKLTAEIEVREKWVLASIEDTGPGISPAEMQKIFQPFFSSKLSTGGSGLGLAITYNIVRRHQGDIRVISHPGEGSRFIVELPRREVPPPTT